MEDFRDDYINNIFKKLIFGVPDKNSILLRKNDSILMK